MRKKSVIHGIGEENEHKKWSQSDNDQYHFGKNWQDFQGERLSILPAILVTHLFLLVEQIERFANHWNNYK